MIDQAILAVGVFLIAFTFAPVGMGGGLIFVPLLHYVGGWTIDGALIAVSLSLTAVVSYGSGLAHRKKGHVSDAAVKSGLVGAVPAALLGVAIVLSLGSDLDLVFKLLSTFMLVWSLRKTLKKLRAPPTSAAAPETEEPPAAAVEHWPLRIGTGIGGMLSSILAIGSGVIYVPVLQQYAHLPTRKAIGSSLHLMMVVVPVAIITHLMFIDASDWETLRDQAWFLLSLPLLTYVGAKLGAAFGMKYISSENILRVFCFLIAVVLVKYLLDVVPQLLALV
ncbi:MAG: sulfite exporter TauE/SafE family protein [Poseidonia sp.]